LEWTGGHNGSHGFWGCKKNGNHCRGPIRVAGPLIPAVLILQMSKVPKLQITESQRVALKEPLGQLVSGTALECNEELKKAREAEKTPRLILVGDTISMNAIQSGIMPDVIIIDHKEKREETIEFSHDKARVFRAINEPATISFPAWQAVAEAIEKGNSAVVVEGEEDLLTLVAIIVAPVGSVVAYGQPDQGIVIVRVTASKKSEIQAQIDQMKKLD
jgi:uncharacterized protein (UPF0218 family)